MSERVERAEAESRPRLTALDAFRGLTVASMLLVNNPGSWSAIYPPLEHAEWHGWTPTDLIFPFFLFIVGITTELSLRSRSARPASFRQLSVHVARRALLILFFGLILSGFPFYSRSVEGVRDPTLWARIADRFAHLRWSGVLQRIAIVYLITAFLTLLLKRSERSAPEHGAARRRSIMIVIAVVASLLFGYWILLTRVTVPDIGLPGSAVLDQPEKTLAAWSDRAVLGSKHIWRGGKWDPEGPLSTIPAIATALLGTLAGTLLASAQELSFKLRRLALGGVVGIIVGLFWDLWFPINKNLWTSSYVVFTAGAAALLLALILWLIEVRQLRAWSKPLLPFGMNPLVAFVGSGLMARITDSMIRWNSSTGKTTLHLWIFDHAFKPWLEPRLASLAYALAFVVLWWAILELLRRREIFLKV